MDAILKDVMIEEEMFRKDWRQNVKFSYVYYIEKEGKKIQESKWILWVNQVCKSYERNNLINRTKQK